VSQNLLQNAVVLKVGQFSSILAGQEEQQTAADQNDQQQGNPEATPTPIPVPDFISLIVAPQDAITLNYLISSGAQLTFVLRNSEDDTRVQTEAVTLQYLLSQYDIPVPVKLPYSQQPRVDQVAPPSFIISQPTPAP
jgi:hypothetical protein